MSVWPAHPAVVFSVGLFMAGAPQGGLPRPSLAAHHAAPAPAHLTGKASSLQVGSAMAVLATLEQAQVLPPEGTREANQVIKSVIQFQSVFMKSTDQAVQDFVRRAVTVRVGEQAEEVLARFRAGGWTPEVLEALADAEFHTPVEELRSLGAGFGQFNLSVEDFRQFMNLVRNGERALAARGRSFREIYVAQRKQMPGAAAQ
jgi:hypothetical protein